MVFRENDILPVYPHAHYLQKRKRTIEHVVVHHNGEVANLPEEDNAHMRSSKRRRIGSSNEENEGFVEESEVMHQNTRSAATATALALMEDVDDNEEEAFMDNREKHEIVATTGTSSNTLEEPEETAWQFFEDLPPHIRIHILEWFPIPDLEFEPNLLKKMDKSQSQFVYSTKNHVLYKYHHLMRYMYGYFSCDATRHIYLIFPSLRITCMQEVLDFPHLAISLPKYPNLTRLCLTRMMLRMEDLPYLPSSLSSVTIVTQQQVDWKVIDALMDRLPNMYYLYLQTKGVVLTPQTEPIFKRMCKLTHVGLINSKVTDDVARIFFDMHGGYENNVQELILTGNRITAEGLAPIRTNTNLKTLRVSKNILQEKGTEHIKFCTSLEEVSVDQCRLSGKSMGHLMEIPRLKRLWCRQNRITNGFENVTKHKHLAILNLHDNNTEISVEMMRALSKCASLHTLVMNKCHLRDDHIIALMEGNETLRRLYINWNEHLTMESIKVIAQNSSLYKLAYSQHRLSDDQLIYLLKHNKTIEVLNVPFVRTITDAFLITLQQCKHLKTLKIRETPVTEQGLRFIKEQCLSVTQLSFGQEKEERWIRPKTDLLKIVD